ncbi:alpha,alpha-trehalase TreF [Mucilaginibacter robiniae]|uniref:Alpha,alpha-trehalase TreF n=1 Tax=Mucilaginibacter robiniae TaxID=2728022 RepID=A0A7L5DW43_9SPHI|nr:alpha,alpha-trehalase TreF [Mucilaginibacter robiniae]QJD95305.1 alpha,alpha-trehalase TreF [Mucilaginibacter robiniae]
MKIFYCLCLFVFYVVADGYAQPKSPAQLYPGLFEAVQMQQVYPDGKTFVDASPKRSAKEVLAAYQQQKDKASFNISAFVKDNFKAPAENSTPYRSNVSAGIRKHIDTLWTVLQHVADTVKGTSLIPLPHPYIVPGGRFREVYYWDSYFTMLGLEDSHRYKLIEHIIQNFAYLIDTYGHIPNGNRTYYLSRSQPPFFALMVEILAKHQGNAALVKYRPELIKEYNYWMAGSTKLKLGKAVDHVVRMPDASLLNRYWDASNQPREESYREDVLAGRDLGKQLPDFYRNLRAAAESGWDFSSRWLADGQHLQTIQTIDFVPIDLNSLLYHLETVIAKSYQLSKQTKLEALYYHKAALRKAALQKYCWNVKAGCYTDYNWVQQKQSTQLSIATAYPLFFNLATQQQAQQIATLVQKRFVQPGGVATTLRKTGQQWDEPNGWAPLQYLAIVGLQNYHQDSLSQLIAQRWMKVNLQTFNQTGKLLEKYDTQNLQAKAGGGEYPLQDGFGWTNGVLLRLMDLYKMK